MRSGLFVVLALVVCARALTGQQAPAAPQPTFRSQVDLVEVDVSVTDARGVFVPDLTAADFEVLEDGRPQTIAALSVVDLPVPSVTSPVAALPADPDVATNAASESRLYVIAMEDSVSSENVPRARAFLRRFVTQYFAPGDIGSVVWVGRGVARDTQDFTSSRRLLLAAIDRFQGGLAPGPEPPPDALRPPTSIPTGSSLPILLPSLTPPDSTESRTRIRSLEDLIEFMAGIPGRKKTLLYVSAGLDFDAFDVLDYHGGKMPLALSEAHAMMTAATRGDVTIYAVDPRGLLTDGGLGEATAPLTGNERTAIRDSQRNLRTFAESTGGFAFTNQNDVGAAFARIVRENSSYYVLGFSPTNARRDGRYRKLDVRVKRPALSVRSRAGYVAPRGGQPKRAARSTAQNLSPAVAEAIARPLPTHGLPIRVVATPYKGAGRQAEVLLVVEADAAGLGLVERDGKFTGSVDVAWSAVRADGWRVRGAHFRSALALEAGTFARASRNGVRFVSTFTLEPGRYQLRVAAGSPTGATGSVIADLEVPDFAEKGLAMAGLTLTTEQAAETPTHVVATHSQQGLPGPPAARRTFASTDRVAVYAEVYRSPGLSQDGIAATALLRDETGQVVRSFDVLRVSSDQGRSGLLTDLSLDGVPSGNYVLRVEARGGAERGVSREIPIRVD